MENLKGKENINNTSLEQSWIEIDLLENMKDNLENYLIKRFQMEEKESHQLTRIINQWQKNDTFYILDKWSEFKLIKDGIETMIKLDKPSIMGETTLLQYLNGQKTSATASVEVKGKYYQISFKNFTKKFEKLDKNEQKAIIELLKELEEKRKGKTKPVT